MSCIPIGSPDFDCPAGTTRLGRPRKFVGRMKRVMAWIAASASGIPPRSVASILRATEARNGGNDHVNIPDGVKMRSKRRSAPTQRLEILHRAVGEPVLQPVAYLRTI